MCVSFDTDCTFSTFRQTFLYFLRWTFCSISSCQTKCPPIIYPFAGHLKSIFIQEALCEKTRWAVKPLCGISSKHSWYGLGDWPYHPILMLIGYNEWKISWFVTGHFTHRAEITCPYGTMPLNDLLLRVLERLLESGTRSLLDYGSPSFHERLMFVIDHWSELISVLCKSRILE